MDCEERDRLNQAAAKAALEYVFAEATLREAPPEEFQATNRKYEEAWEHYLQASGVFESHVRSHGCEGHA